MPDDHVYLLPEEITNDLVYSIGAVTVASSRLELLAGIVYARLLGGGLVAEMVTVGQSWRTVYGSATVILDRLSPIPVVTDLIAAFDRADKVYKERSEIVHGFWLDVSKDGHRIAVQARSHGRRGAKEWTVAELEAMRAELVAVGTELQRLGGELPHDPSSILAPLS